jgi:hypothetical protein
MLTNTQTRVSRNFPRHPHTALMGLMGLALLAVTGWAFVHELIPGAQGPSLARQAPAAVHAPVKG